MTANTTEQERAEFEAWASSEEYPISRCFDDGSMYEYTVTQRKWDEWKAARRAPAVPVPQETCVICGSDEPYTGTCGSNDPRALCKKPAPQPPEADHIPDAGKMVAAPVQLPEPVAYLHECGKKPSLRTLEFSKVAIQLSAKGYKSLPLYTEQQVRELLATHGIEEPQ